MQNNLAVAAEESTRNVPKVPKVSDEAARKQAERMPSIQVSHWYTRGTLVNVTGVFFSLAGIAISEISDEGMFAVVGIALMILLLPVYVFCRWRAGVWEEQLISVGFEPDREVRPIPVEVLQFSVLGIGVLLAGIILLATWESSWVVKGTLLGPLICFDLAALAYVRRP